MTSKCSECAGAGEIVIYGGKGGTRKETCGKCQGSGN